DAARPAAKRLRVGFTTASRARVDPAVDACVRDVARLLDAMGHEVSEGGPDSGPFHTPFQLVVVTGLGSLPLPDQSLLEPSGQPAISLPLGVDASGLPIGVQLVGPPRGEHVILSLAAELEHARPWSGRRPPIREG